MDECSAGAVSTGIDIESIKRIGRALEKRGFSERVFTPAELGYALGRRAPERHLAGRFAAKEACAKALGTGIAGGVRLKDIEVVAGHSGKKASLRLSAEAGRLLGSRKAHLSIAYAEDLALALVVIE